MFRFNLARSAMLCLSLAAALLVTLPALAKGKGSKNSKVMGTITAVDTGLSTVTFQPATGSPVVVNVTATTKIEINDSENQTVTDLANALAAATAAGQTLVGKAVYSPTTMNAIEIEAESSGGSGNDD